MVVRGRYLRLGAASSSWERKAVPKHKPLEVSELGFTEASDWATSRILSGRWTPQMVKDRALLMVSDVQCAELLDAASALPLQAALPESLGGHGACLAENIYVAGNATATTLCVGDVLVVVGTAKRRRGTATTSDMNGDPTSLRDPAHGASLLRLQVSSPCLPCSKVDQHRPDLGQPGRTRRRAARGYSWLVRARAHPGGSATATAWLSASVPILRGRSRAWRTCYTTWTACATCRAATASCGRGGGRRWRQPGQVRELAALLS